jgi:hypothetical protein
MKFINWRFLVSTAMLMSVTIAQPLRRADADDDNKLRGPIRHVLLISIDGMHALDLENCIKGVNGLTPYCPNLATLAQNGTRYTQASSAKPSDSFPGLPAMLTGGSPRSTGVFYDNSYDRSLAPPQNPTNGINNGNCMPGKAGPGTEALFDESIDIDLTRLDGGGGINMGNLPRDPFNNCQPVFPHQYLRANTIFDVVKKAGGYTAWSDKNWGYDIVRGPSGKGVDDLFIAEIKSNIVPLPGIPGCTTVPDPSVASDWTLSFDDVKCYDAFKVQAIINEIDGKTHDGSHQAPVPTIFGMNFQAVSVGQKLVTKTITGGYKDALGTPSDALLGEIKFVDQSIGAMVSELDKRGLLRSTVVIVSAKHGQAPINPSSVKKIGDAITPVLTAAGISVAQATEDDVALLWLNDQTRASDAAAAISAKASMTGLGEIFVGNAITQLFNDPSKDPRTPDLIVSPNTGVIYTTSGKKQAEHGGFNHDDTNVALLVFNPALTGQTLTNLVNTAQIAPTILVLLGLDANQLQAVKKEDTQLLPGLFEEEDH